MNFRGRNDTIIIEQKDAPDITVELAEYLDVLGSEIRLNILKLLGSEPMDVELVSHLLFKRFNKVSARTNTKKHIDKLMNVGLVMPLSEAGKRNSRWVTNYVLVPGGIETAMRTLKKVMRIDLGFEVGRKVEGVRNMISEEFSDTFAVVKVLGGVDDGREFLLKEPEVNIGRIDINNPDRYDPKTDVVLSNQYRAVTRVGKPHARLLLLQDEWFIELCEGQNPTYLWDKKLQKRRKQKLNDGDIIHFAEGLKGVRLLFLNPQLKNKK
jgi:hypothetical protein